MESSEPRPLFGLLRGQIPVDLPDTNNYDADLAFFRRDGWGFPVVELDVPDVAERPVRVGNAVLVSDEFFIRAIRALEDQADVFGEHDAYAGTTRFYSDEEFLASLEPVSERARSRREFGESRLTKAQSDLLARIRAEGGTRVTVRKQYYRTVKALEQYGLVRRVPPTDDEELWVAIDGCWMETDEFGGQYCGLHGRNAWWPCPSRTEG